MLFYETLGNNRETIDVHTKSDYRPPPVRKHDASLKKERCHGKLLGHCENTKHDWGRGKCCETLEIIF